MGRKFFYGLILAFALGGSLIGAWTLFQRRQNHNGWERTRDLELSVTVERNVISVGEDIEFVLTLRNKGNENVTFWMGPPFFDLCLYDSNDVLVARWTEGRGFPEYIKKIVLEPEGTFSETIQWNLYSYDHETGGFIPVEPGQYSISSVWLGETHMETTKVSITVKK